MSKKKKQKTAKKKSDIDFKGLAVQAIADLIIGITLLILDKLLN